jgi:diguanylate cyclase (GGDEF)-like protein
MLLFSPQQNKSLLIFIIFCLLIGGGGAYYLKVSLGQEESKTRERTNNTSFLIGEWIKGAFEASDYILRDMVYTVPVTELQYPAKDPESHARITTYIDDKRKTLPYANGVGLNDRKCIVTHTLSIVGFDASQREWCSTPKNNPKIQTYVSNMFTSNNVEPMVIQARKFPGEEFNGLAGIGVNLKFFSKWLENISIGPHEVIAIVDQDNNLLSKKPFLSGEIGKKLEHSIAQTVLVSGNTYKTFREDGWFDKEPRLYSIRKVDGLPFVVLVGEADRNWQANWFQSVWVTISAISIMWLLSFTILRAYWAKVSQLTELQSTPYLLEKLSVTDALTGLANRRRFNDVLAAEFLRMRRLNAPLSLIMIDVDYFKTFNDTYGHQAGDECLKHVSQVLKSNLKRPQDLAARYGGEEFCCVLPETDYHGTLKIATNIKNAISDQKIPHKNSSISNHVTVSLGVATVIPEEDMSPDKIVNLADNRLYWAKKNGRNRVGTDIDV